MRPYHRPHFPFSNSRRDRLKLVYFDGSGLWVCSKRMQRGTLCWPGGSHHKVQLTQEQFALLIGGMDLTQTRERKWYRKAVGEEPQKLLKGA